MPTKLKSQDVSSITAEIAASIRDTLKSTTANIISIGRKLSQAKELLEHGQWLPWLAKECLLSERSAQRYMQAARFASKYDTVADLAGLEPSALYWLARFSENPENDAEVAKQAIAAVFEAAKTEYTNEGDAERICFEVDLRLNGDIVSGRTTKPRRPMPEPKTSQQNAEPEPRRPYQPPHGYKSAKAILQAAGHNFERARREAGFEEGVFVDGAFVSSNEVIALAELPPHERQHRLADARRNWKDFACSAVLHYMHVLQVTLDELAEANRNAPAAIGAKAKAA